MNSVKVKPISGPNPFSIIGKTARDGPAAKAMHHPIPRRTIPVRRETGTRPCGRCRNIMVGAWNSWIMDYRSGERVTNEGKADAYSW